MGLLLFLFVFNAEIDEQVCKKHAKRCAHNEDGQKLDGTYFHCFRHSDDITRQNNDNNCAYPKTAFYIFFHKSLSCMLIFFGLNVFRAFFKVLIVLQRFPVTTPVPSVTCEQIYNSGVF